jgi:TolB-like protein
MNPQRRFLEHDGLFNVCRGRLSAMKRFFLLSGLFAVILISGAAAQERRRMALVDFEVSSDNPALKNLGKGFVEFIAVDLSKSKSVLLIDRAKRNDVIREQEFSISDLAESAKQVRLGQMLSAEYLVTGNLFDIQAKLSVVFQVVSVKTGEVVFKDKAAGPIENYDALSAEVAARVLAFIKADVPAAVTAKAGDLEPGKQAAAVAFSDAMDAYDRHDVETARKQLAVAEKEDPKNEAIRSYLAKLGGASPRFRTELEAYAPSFNPAYLGLITEDSFYSFGSFTSSFFVPVYSLADGYTAIEDSGYVHIGYQFPVGESFGIGVETVGGFYTAIVNAPYAITYEGGGSGVSLSDNLQNLGVSLNVGYKIIDGLSLGAEVFIFYNRTRLIQQTAADSDAAGFSGAIGLVAQPWGDFVTFDLQAVYSSHELHYLDTIEQTAHVTNFPTILDGTLTFAFLDKTLFLAIKEIGELHLRTHGGFVSRTIGSLEYWPAEFLSLRAGYEFTYLALAGFSDPEHGFIAGVSLHVGKFDIDLNVTRRSHPLRILPGYSFMEWAFLFGVSFRPGWIKR